MKGRLKRQLCVYVALGMGASLLIPGVSFAADRDDLVNEQSASQQKITQLNADLEGLSDELREATIALVTTRDKIPGAEAELAKAQAELSAAQREAQANAALLAAAEKELAGIQETAIGTNRQVNEARASVAELARLAYRGEALPSTLDLLANSATPEEFMNMYRVNEALTRAQTTALTQFEQDAGQVRNRQARQSAVKERVNELKQQADALVRVQQEKQDAAEYRRNELKRLEKTIAEKSAVLESRKGEVQRQIDSENAEYAQITKQIQAIDAENRRKAAAAAAAAAAAQRDQVSSDSGSSEPSGGSSWGGGGFIQSPIRTDLYVTSSYGWRIHPITGYETMHYGVDLAAGCGLPQYAAAPGTVSYAGWYGGGGNTIAINHGMNGGSSWLTRYMHFDSLNVSVGQYVDRNTVIGYTGTTGGSTGCHVHFEVWQDGSTINPMGLIG
ncbi:MAG: peptidoglycan DD-metalloendopeptidase family protein [Actinomycetaceae bacterium]|nr:peptidoglycan DD-metalloendopeptidase family protein [Actinomycetaceae bacterium]MDY5854624.1 peptidoglycan DD-metalloendopeptidase family protein [Arcanobacterium sp.]